MTDAEAVEQLVNHRYFKPHKTPLQIFNRSTDPFLAGVRDHLFAVLEDIDARGLTNHALVITRAVVRETDCARLNALKNLKLTLLFTYSGIEDRRVEPYPSSVAAASLRRATAYGSADEPRRCRTILYWRPLVPGLNDTDDHLQLAVRLSASADATVFTGLFYRDQIAEYYKANGIPQPYEGTARRKIVPEALDRRIVEAFAGRPDDAPPLFRKTSCGVSYAHGLPDYNGHYGIRELCDICPMAQSKLCAGAHQMPTTRAFLDAAADLPEAAELKVLDVTSRAVQVDGLPSEQPRYFLQHAFAFQVHDAGHPHHLNRHGRADIGWEATTNG
ncbi:hypothetical protein [Kribbella sp. NPDC055071]